MPTDQPLTLGQYLRQERKRLGMSVDELVSRSGINRSHLFRIERDQRTPKPTTLTRLATALDLDLADLSAVAGYPVASELPAPMLYLRAKYRDLPEADLAALTADVARVLAEHGLDGDSRPGPGEDEAGNAPTASSHSKGGRS